jgi:hypothetical protein
MIANSIMAYMAMFRNGQDRSLQSKTLGSALTPNSYFLTPNLPFLRYYDLGQYRIILSADTASEVRQMPSQKRR